MLGRQRAAKGASQCFGFASTGLTADDFRQPGAIIRLGRPPYRIDILTSITDVEFAEAWASRAEGMLEGLPVHFVSKELLIPNTRACGRPNDIADIEAIKG